MIAKLLSKLKLLTNSHFFENLLFYTLYILQIYVQNIKSYNNKKI